MEGSRKEVKGEMCPNEQRIGTDTISQDKKTNFYKLRQASSLGRSMCGRHCCWLFLPHQDPEGAASAPPKGRLLIGPGYHGDKLQDSVWLTSKT